MDQRAGRQKGGVKFKNKIKFKKKRKKERWKSLPWNRIKKKE